MEKERDEVRPNKDIFLVPFIDFPKHGNSYVVLVLCSMETTTPTTELLALSPLVSHTVFPTPFPSKSRLS